MKRKRNTQSPNNSTNPIKAGLGYSIANILIKSIGVITLPIFGRLLSTDEYGIYSVFMAYSTILSYIIGCTLNISIKRANIEFPGRIDEYTSSVSIIYKGNLLIYTILIIILGPYIGSLLDLDTLQLVLLGIVAEATAFLSLYSVKVSLEYNYLEYLKWAAISSIGSVVLSVLLMLSLFSENHLLGRIVGHSIAVSLASLLISLKLFKKHKPRINKVFWKFGLKYSIPIVPNGIAQVLLNQFDRVMIKNLTSASDAGIYSFAGNIKLVVTVLSDSISTVYSTWFFDTMAAGERKKIQEKSYQILLVFLAGTGVLMAISPELLQILGPGEYSAGKHVLIPMIAEGMILFAYCMVVQGEYYEKKTIFVFLGTLFAAIIDIILNFFFIKEYGFVAAAYTTLFSYLLYLLLHIIISRRVIGFFILRIKDLGFCLSVLFVYSFITVLSIDNTLARLISIIPFLSLIVIVLNRHIQLSDNVGIINYVNRLFKTITNKGDEDK